MKFQGIPRNYKTNNGLQIDLPKESVKIPNNYKELQGGFVMKIDLPKESVKIPNNYKEFQGIPRITRDYKIFQGITRQIMNKKMIYQRKVLKFQRIPRNSNGFQVLQEIPRYSKELQDK